MLDSRTRESSEGEETLEQRFLLRYTLLTISLFLPLMGAFGTLSNFYPVASWTVMKGGNLQSGQRYFVLRGETVSGELIDIRPTTLTDGLYARTWGLVAATVDNRSFQLRSPHPANAALLAAPGAKATIPRAARLPELLRAWGAIYNSRLPASSSGRLKAIRLDAYQWPGTNYSNYDQFLESWREEL